MGYADNFKKGQEIFIDGKLHRGPTSKPTLAAPVFHPWWQFTQYRRKEESTPEAPTPDPVPSPVAADTKRRRRESSNYVTGTGGVSSSPGTMQTTHLNLFKIKMNSSTSYRTWIGLN